MFARVLYMRYYIISLRILVVYPNNASVNVKGFAYILNCNIAYRFTGMNYMFMFSDPAFSAKLLNHSKQIYTFGKTYPGIYSQSVKEAGPFYGYDI